eukprot:577125_1
MISSTTTTICINDLPLVFNDLPRPYVFRDLPRPRPTPLITIGLSEPLFIMILDRSYWVLFVDFIFWIDRLKLKTNSTMAHIENKVVIVNKTNKDSIWIVSVNRPSKRNACNAHVQKLLYDTFISFEKDPKSKVAILRGEGGNFCAGADLSAVANPQSDLIPNATPMIHIDKAIHSHESFTISPYMDSMGFMGISRLLLTKPTIACVSGYAVAGGLELALWCDIRVANNTAKFGVFCRRFGVPLMDGGTVRLPQTIGLSNAMDMILTGCEVNAQRAKEIGLISRLIDTESDEKLLNTTIDMAKMICSFPQNCMKLDRMNVYKNLYGDNLLHALKYETQRALASNASKDIAIGPKQFVKGIGKHGQFQSFTANESKL